MTRIEGRARTIREVLDGNKYSIDFYQRKYAWEERHVRELIDDLTGKFLDFYKPDHSRMEVEQYGHYFLGSIVLSHKRGKRFIVDGQQRLTTLTLLLIYLDRRQKELEDRVDVRNLIYSEKYGRQSFNMEIEDRNKAMKQLMEGTPGKTVGNEGGNESVRNIGMRYENIDDHFPEEINPQAVPYFVDWLLDNVYLVAIEADSDEDAYTIFETMNDRGLSLSLPEMLKGYVLSSIHNEEDQRTVNKVWKDHMAALNSVSKDQDADFFKNWLRARYAETFRPGRKGSENMDYERVGSEFHRWVRDHKELVGLGDSSSFITFVERDLDFYAKQTLKILRAGAEFTEGWESVYYNQNLGFTLQTQALLAPLEASDPPEIVHQKIAMVSDFLDIWLVRRVWNFRTIAYSSVRYTLFNLTKEMRGKDLEGLSEYLRQQLDEQPETFATEPNLRLHKQNYRHIRHILARLTHWVETSCGLPSHFEDLVSKGPARPFEIEHIWENRYDRFGELYDHPSDFELARERLGGLLLLQSGLNQSLGDEPYSAKKKAYATKGSTLLARSLHSSAYLNNPSFTNLINRTGLPFKAYDEFGPEEQTERQELYIQIAEMVWNPTRLDMENVLEAGMS